MSVIYKIFCKNENIKECYIGSTNDFKARKNQHKFRCNDNENHNALVYKFIRTNGGFENFDFVILEQFETIINKNDLFIIEGQYIKNTNATLNCKIAGRTKQEWYLDNKTKITEQKKKYREENKTEILENKKKYYEKNKLKLSEKCKIHYQENKTEILKQLQKKVECIYCKSLISKNHILRHQQSTKKCILIQNTNQI